MKRLFSLLLLGTTLLACSTQPSQPESLETLATFGGYKVDVVATNRWNSGFQGAVVLKNTNGAAAESFEIKFKFNGNNPITSSWGGNFSAPNGGVITLTSPSYLRSNKVTRGTSFSSGFVARNAFSGATVTSLKINGKVVGGGVGPTDPTNPPAPAPGDKLCEDFAQINVGPYLYQNNTWGADKLGAGESFTQCLVTRTVSGKRQIGWTWDWPGLEPTVYSYPEIIYGWKPWSGGANSAPTNLPVQAGKVGNIDLNFAFDQRATGSYNMAAEVWFTRSGRITQAPNANDITTEIMFWVNSTVSPAGSKVAEVTIGGKVYEVWYLKEIGRGAKPNGDGWRYVAYRSKSQQTQGTLPLDAFIRDSLRRGYLSSSEYLVTIEMGNEVSGGKGTTYFKRYDISFTD